MKRVPTCITGLDRLLEGGYPSKGAILVNGEPGTGKTLLGLQFLHEGAKKYNEPGMLIQVEEFNDTLLWYEQMLGFDFAGMQEKAKLAIYSFKPKEYSKFSPQTLHGEVLGKLRTVIASMNIKRVVIDSVTPLRAAMDNEADFHRSLYETIDFFKENGVTTMIIGTETVDDRLSIEYMCDGVLSLRQYEAQNKKFFKELRVKKMVATNFPSAWFPVTISDRMGFTVRPFL